MFVLSARSFPHLASYPLVSATAVSWHRALSTGVARLAETDNRASSKLFEDAACEEAEEAAAPVRTSRVSILEGQNENWTGEESMQDAVLRMLVDKYKPLRSGPIRTADEKLEQTPPRVSEPHSSSEAAGGPDVFGSGSVVAERVSQESPRRYRADEPLLPSIEGHQPWHTTFKVPSHATSSVRYGHFPAPPRTSQPLPMDEKAKRKEREDRRRTEHAGRLSRARESTLDYRLGIRKGAETLHRPPTPATMKGWASLVEDRIERARQEGLFKTIKGRGQPMASTTQERNPFIGREEFLMNRIVQRQGAAPPWVEVQGELESAIASFRDVIRQSWTRRAIRMLTASQPASALPTLTVADIAALRDREWETRERAFHDQALEEVNALVRKYNGLAPYAVRRAYYMRDTELSRAYRDAAEDILHGLAERVNAIPSDRIRGHGDESDSRTTAGGSAAVDSVAWSFRDMFRELWTTIRGRA
ncbi:hypothetical protein WOLCODRAFT_162553 [Wolfiporia cocos MD-104 SS10]|uniref:DnaJ homologue subfamily C member 28 conserved domain-containing protein n=1 Tax=Wolfiporia cocos (strain MD-104) TaxID=742152 RepID=A0A2H3JVQ5_WOLCO|nr:hypothetical protein WOLCODRAFT_162553 [Wolfiporia cocos MD-104 SS10]